MANELRCVVSISGIRGVVGETLSCDEVLRLAAAYAQAVCSGRGTVILGRDSRPTGTMFSQAVAAGLRGAGCDVLDLGLVPTPTVPLILAQTRAAGGIQVSASHNPIQWNALKFFLPSGRNVDQAALDSILSVFRAGPIGRSWEGCGSYARREDACREHIERVLAVVDAGLIRRRAFTVLIDSVNGAGSESGPELLRRLGCRVVPVFTRPDQPFPRDPEPTARNVAMTGALVRAANADIGFVQDPDADRLAIIDDRGCYIGEEYTLVLCAAARLGAEHLAGRSGVAVTNLSTSRMLEDVAARYGARVVRSAVGEANVVDAMEQEGAVIGGEGNGGVIEPRVVWCRDSLTGMALVLEHLARCGQSLSQAVEAIPRYHMHKEKVPWDRARIGALIQSIKASALACGAALDERDGLKLSWSDRWLHVRASGTEPASRIIAEAPSQDGAQALAAAVRELAG